MFLSEQCHYCPLSKTCTSAGLLNSVSPCSADQFIEKQGGCPEQRCAWYSFALNPRVCDALFPLGLGLATLTMVLATLFLPLLYTLSMSPWLQREVDDAHMCVFTHEPTDGTRICARCGVVAAQLKTVAGRTQVCVGCHAVYVGRTLLGICFLLCALSISVFFIGWTGAFVPLIMIAVVWLVCFPTLLWRLFRQPVRRFLVGTPHGYAAVGAHVTENDIAPAQLALLAVLPDRHRQAVIGSLRYDEDVLWAHRPAALAVFMRDFTARAQLAAFLVYTVPLVVSGLLLHIAYNSRAVLYLFCSLAVLMAFIAGPPLVPLVLRARCAYVLTSRRALIVRPLVTGGMMTDATDYRVMRELRVHVEPDGRTGAVTWQSLFSPGFQCVDDVARVRAMLAERCNMAVATVAAAAAAGALAEDAESRPAEALEMTPMSSVAGAPAPHEPTAGDADSAAARPAGGGTDQVADATRPAAGGAGGGDELVAPGAPAPPPALDEAIRTVEAESNRLAMLATVRSNAKTQRSLVYLPIVTVAVTAVLTALGAFPFVLLAVLGPLVLGLTLVFYQSHVQLSDLAAKLDSHR